MAAMARQSFGEQFLMANLNSFFSVSVQGFFFLVFFSNIGRCGYLLTGAACNIVRYICDIGRRPHRQPDSVMAERCSPRGRSRNSPAIFSISWDGD